MENVNNSQTIHIEGHDISLGDISNTVSVSSSDEDLLKLFTSVLESAQNKQVVTVLERLMAEIEKGDQANESIVREHLEQIWQMAPDIWDVITDTATNPLKGASTVVKKILKKVRDEKESKSG